MGDVYRRYAVTDEPVSAETGSLRAVYAVYEVDLAELLELASARLPSAGFQLQNEILPGWTSYERTPDEGITIIAGGRLSHDQERRADRRFTTVIYMRPPTTIERRIDQFRQRIPSM
jgi:hypothetical protein